MGQHLSVNSLNVEVIVLYNLPEQGSLILLQTAMRRCLSFTCRWNTLYILLCVIIYKNLQLLIQEYDIHKVYSVHIHVIL